MHQRFEIQIAGRVAAIVGVAVGCGWVVAHWNAGSGLTLGVAGVLLVLLVRSLVHYANDTNRRLVRFFDSIRYSDFAVRFAPADQKNDSFGALSRQFNHMLESFRQTRAEKESNLVFLHAIVQHLGTGILVFDAQHRLLISNSTAFQLLGVYRLTSLADLPTQHADLVGFVQHLKSKNKLLYHPQPDRQLAVQGLTLQLQGQQVVIVTLQDIHSELQRKELDAWRNLTRVLRHEMMNSITPIVTLADTMRDIVRDDLRPVAPTADLEEAIDIIGARSRSLLDFVEAYRSFSALPMPRVEVFGVKNWIEKTIKLVAPDLKKQQIDLHVEPIPDELSLCADAGQLDMVLLNLLKNAQEALVSGPRRVAAPRITVAAGTDARGRVFVRVDDNGPGMAPELMDEVFIPFFSTKTTGTGIGLSISRHIMQQHNGDVRVESEVGEGTTFWLVF
jgi:two-component system, NtrC family, nitrogen regulation sensor histidine kinase NtrY